MATLPQPIGYGKSATPNGSVASFSLGRNDAPQILAGAADEVGRATAIIQQTNAKQDEMAALDAANKLKQQALLLEQDPESGFGSAKGNAVVGEQFTKGYQERFNGAAEQISGQLKNDYQREVFKRHQEVVGLQYQSTLLRHQAKETVAFNQQTRTDTVNVGMDDIASHPYDDSTYQTNMLLIGRSVVDTGKDMGLTGEALAKFTENKLGDITSKALQSRISAMLTANDGESAQKYFDQHKGEMRLDAVQSVKRAISEVDNRNTAQKFADESVSSGLSLQDSLDKAREQFPPEMAAKREAVIHAVKTRFDEHQAVKLQDQKQATDSAWKVITNGGSRRQIPPTLWDRLNGEEQRQINDYEDAKIRRAKLDAKNEDPDPATYMRLREMAANEPSKFALSVDLERVAPMVSKQHLDKLIELKAGITNGDAKVMESQATVKRTIGMLKSEIQAAGIDLSPQEGTKAAKETAAFFGAVTQALDEATAAKGSPLTGDEARRIGQSYVREGYEQGSGIFSPNKVRGFQMESGKSYVSKLFDDIPDNAKKVLVQEVLSLPQASRTRGGGLTSKQEAAVERAYQKGLESGRFK